MTDTSTEPALDLVVDRALRRAHEALCVIDRTIATFNGERASRVISGQLDTALLAVETLLELRAGDQALTAQRFRFLKTPAGGTEDPTIAS